MTPDEHAERATDLLERAEGMSPTIPMRASLERQAIAHAVLSTRLAPVEFSTIEFSDPGDHAAVVAPKPPARKRAAKKTTTTKKEKDS